VLAKRVEPSGNHRTSEGKKTGNLNLDGKVGESKGQGGEIVERPICQRLKETSQSKKEEDLIRFKKGKLQSTPTKQSKRQPKDPSRRQLNGGKKKVLGVRELDKEDQSDSNRKG